MENSSEHIDDLIAKILAGEAGREEIDSLEGWLGESKENREYYDQTKKMFAAFDSVKTEQTVNVDKAWTKLDERISNKDAKVISLFSRPVFRVAASIMLLALLAIITNYVLNSNIEPPVVLAATTKAMEQKLPDGSKVFINKNSEISYVVNKNHEREVKLKGEAYFEVVHNEKQPFVITIDDVMIKDIGTAFNVKAIPGSNTIEVLVEEGEVHFYTSSNIGFNLVKDEKAVYDVISKQFAKSIPAPVENTTSYRSKVFHFKGTPLKDVIAQVNEVYGSNIKLSDEKIGDCLLSVIFTNESLDNIILLITETLNLTAENSGGIILLKGNSCTN